MYEKRSLDIDIIQRFDWNRDAKFARITWTDETKTEHYKNTLSLLKTKPKRKTTQRKETIRRPTQSQNILFNNINPNVELNPGECERTREREKQNEKKEEVEKYKTRVESMCAILKSVRYNFKTVWRISNQYNDP